MSVAMRARELLVTTRVPAIALPATRDSGAPVSDKFAVLSLLTWIVAEVDSACCPAMTIVVDGWDEAPGVKVRVQLVCGARLAQASESCVTSVQPTGSVALMAVAV